MITKEDRDLISKIENAIQSTIEDEIDLLANGKVERTFTSYLAAHIFKNLDIENIRTDPFYNKHFTHINKAKKLRRRTIELDIAIHERNTDERNLVVIELETNNNPKGDDVWKIEKMTVDSSDFDYKLGLYIVFGVRGRAGEIIMKNWYKNGGIVNI